MKADRTGYYKLKEGVHLVGAPEGGIVLQTAPMRVLKVNRAAFELLKQCAGDPPPKPEANRTPPDNLSFLEVMHTRGILTWTPGQPACMPFVSIVVPVYNRPADTQACLESLLAMDYPRDRMEVIVVDDASSDHTAAVARRFGVKLLVQPHNRGQSAARNRAVATARGELIAFIDSDCTADSNWLRELVPYFQDPQTALVGGYVDSFYRRTRLDRYEAVCSALNMGSKPVTGLGPSSVFYVPTCNMLVRKAAYAAIGGLDETRRLGEDVDLCWRLLDAGHTLMYVPSGKVLHKHRNRLWPGFVRRFEYGTSEAGLYARFDRASKQFPWQPAGIGILAFCMAALAAAAPLCLVPAVLILAAEMVYKHRRVGRRMGIRLPISRISAALIQSHFELAYALSWYLVRYYLLAMILICGIFDGLLPLGAALILFPTWMTYRRKKPQLVFPVFAFFYLAEQAFYQSGAFWGCVKEKSFRLYRITFRPDRYLPVPPAKAAQRAARPYAATK